MLNLRMNQFIGRKHLKSIVVVASILVLIFALLGRGSGQADPVAATDPIAPWFDLFKLRESLVDLNDEDFAKQLDSLSKIQRSLVSLRRAHSRSVDPRVEIDEAKKALVESYGIGSKDPYDDVLVPYLLEEISSSMAATQQDKDFANSVLASLNGRSCPEKEYLLTSLQTSDASSRSEDYYKRQVKRVFEFLDKDFREEALDTLLGSVSPDQKSGLGKVFSESLAGFPDLSSRYSWVEVDSAPDLWRSAPFKAFGQVRDFAKRSQCKAGRDLLVQELATVKLDESKVRTEFEKTLSTLESCYRRQNSRARRFFWAQILPVLDAKLGPAASTIAQLRLAQLDWSDDRFDSARSMLESVLKAAREKSLPEAEREALFTLARLEENDGNLESSLVYFDEFANRFQTDPRYLEAKSNSVLLDVMLNRPDKALVDAESIIQQQSALEPDLRSTAELSFALFWAGKLLFAQGKKDQAFAYWSRVAVEYYSTFYGAMGHYLVESQSEKRLPLGPNATSKFDLPDVLTRMSVGDRGVLRSVVGLSRLGLKEDTICEMKELAAHEGNPVKLMLLSLYNHAGGQWLTSIKYFDQLPRSFRDRLPIGFERLLFPRRYEDYVSKYSGRLGLDPDLITSIIRQESVFNPRARSGVGASGLMQLMPATARYESKRLSSGYLDSSERDQLRRRVQERQGLLDADLNIALGVQHVHRLFQRYQHPVYVLTSYNANPRATAKWLRSLATSDDLIFIERIPFKETKQYVKLVMRNYFYYKRWYGDRSGRIPLLDQLALGREDVAQL